MNVAEFVEKWKKVELTERSASQQHFLDLCELLDHPKPAAVDPTGERFTFEKGATKKGGGDGWADVWKRDYFAWEYKGKHKDLDAAYLQLDQYRAALENPPLLVTCDMDRLVVYTNFTATRQEVHDIPLAELGEPRNLEILRAVFTAPHKLKPGATSEAITADAASRVGELAVTLRERGLDSRDVAHFLDRIVFSFFAEDVGLLPEMVVTRLLEQCRSKPEIFPERVRELFRAMRDGGYFGIDEIPHFNGNLFESGPVLELSADEIARLYQAARLDWSAIDPSIFGTLFERGMDPAKRSQLGAHYTSREDIETLVEPVVMKPLRREWNEIQQVVANLLSTGKKKPTEADREKGPPTGRRLNKARNEAQIILRGFHQSLAQIKVLDPACGSGNFLYVTLQKLKDLEKEVIWFAMDQGFPGEIPLVGPWQLYGIEINPYAFELAQMTVWIGYLQWIRKYGFGTYDDPILRRIDTFECKDAVLDLSDPENPREPEWPRVDFIIGNPPFLGDKLMRRELGDAYVEQLRAYYSDRIPGQSDLCCYWFERSLAELKAGRCRRVGLLATQAIRGGASRQVLRRITEVTEIIFAESDRPWVLEGANVHVAMIGFGAATTGTHEERVLDGRTVSHINTDLTSATDVTKAVRLPARRSSFIGVAQKAPFDISDVTARALLSEPNPSGRPNSDVLRLVANAKDLTKRPRNVWNIDFGIDRSVDESALYEGPFEWVRETILPLRINHREKRQEDYWWLFARPSPDMRAAVEPLERFIATPRVSKHRVFCWLRPEIIPDSALVVFASSQDLFFGILHSGIHELWARAKGTQLRERESGFRYTPTSCFQTFPFPAASDEQSEAIAAAARELNDLRERWLNPPEWVKEEILEFPGAVDGPWARYVHDPDERGIGTVRYPRLVAKDDEAAAKLAKRTLTNLYNQRPTWLDHAHRKLDEAVAAAYGWPPDLPDEEILERLLALNLERAG